MTSSKKGRGKTEKGEPERLKDRLNAAFANDEGKTLYITDCWWANLIVARGQWKSDRNWYYSCRLIATGGSVLLPASASGQAATNNNPILVASTIVISLVVAITGGILQLRRSQDRYKLRMLQHHQLESAGWELLLSIDDQEGAFKEFRASVDSALDTYRAEVVKFLDGTSDTAAQSKLLPTAGERRA